MANSIHATIVRYATNMACSIHATIATTITNYTITSISPIALIISSGDNGAIGSLFKLLDEFFPAPTCMGKIVNKSDHVIRPCNQTM